MFKRYKTRKRINEAKRKLIATALKIEANAAQTKEQSQRLDKEHWAIDADLISDLHRNVWALAQAGIKS